MHPYNRKTMRIKGFHYGTSGDYFITICTYKKLCFFGRVKNNKIELSEAGEYTKSSIEFINTHYQNVELRNYTVMPNHVHMIITIHGAGGYTVPQALPMEKKYTDELIDFPQQVSIVDIVRNLKTFTGNFFYNKQKCNLWQRGYYDHIISDDADFRRISEYINDNLKQWQNDKFYYEIGSPTEVSTGHV